MGGCSNIQGTKLYAPSTFGLISIAPNIYVEPEANEGIRGRLIEARTKAESAIKTAYGSVKSGPTIHACVTESCYETFGGRGSLAKVYGNHILLSPRALNWHLLAHEWSHAEISARLNRTAWFHMPQWFDEGVAVATSEAPEHSEEHWQYLIREDIPRPTRQELMMLKSLHDWLNATTRYGETKNAERKAMGQPEIRPVYAAAGHELRSWLAKVGTAGLLELIDRLNGGEDFDVAYQSIASTELRTGNARAR